MYFQPVHEASYANSRLAALQHQLHISTIAGNPFEHAGSAWSNLIIPYQTPCTTPNAGEEYKPEEEAGLGITDEDKPEAKKKNPYSIEELLKKPDKRSKPPDVSYLGVQQPYGVFVRAECEDDGVTYQSGSPIAVEGTDTF